MITVSNDFKTEMQKPIKKIGGYLALNDGSEIDVDLVSYKIDTIGGSKEGGGLLKTTMRRASIILQGDYSDLVGSTLDIYYGAEIAGTFEYVLLGKFEVAEIVLKKEEETTTLTAYDGMMKFYKDYTAVSGLPTDLFGYLQSVCSGAGIELENESIYNGDIDILEDYYKDIPDITFRDVVEDICEVSVTQARILPNGHLFLGEINDTGETLDYGNLFKYELGKEWGGVNSVVLSRQPQNDDIFKRDEEDISSPTNRNIMDINRFNQTYTEGEA